MNLRPLVLVLSTFVATLLLQACGQQEGKPVADAAPAAATVTVAASEPLNAEPSAAGAAATYQDLKGNPVEIADYAGKKVFVNYWATWCAPCIQEIPSINRAADALASENVVFLLASDEKLDKINDFLLDRGFTGNFVKFNSYVGALGIDVMPTSVLYDEQGVQVKSWTGPYEWDSAEMLAQIRNPQ
ncbi:MAG: TlpA disulfide reductase family protein [Pseudomonadota bacterium]